MRISEFHFNPKIRPDLIFDSFCFEPENIYEKRVGSLYMVGLLKNTLPKNAKLLENLAQIIRREYYRQKALSPEKALKEGLKEANNFLEEVGKKGDVSWLGNLSFLVTGLKSFKWNFSKVGEIKIFLLRGGKIVDVEKRAKLGEIEPYPLRVFGSLVSGKMAEGDAILVLTKEVFDFLERENSFKEIGEIGFVDEKILKEIFERKRDEVLKISGICLLIHFTKEVLPKKRKVFLKKISPKKIGFKEIFSPLFDLSKKFKFPKINPKKIELPKLKSPSFRFNKKIILVLFLGLILFFGYLFSRYDEEKEIKKYEEILAINQKKYDQAESYLILKNQKLDEEGERILKEILNDISPFLSKKMPTKLKENFSLLEDKTLEKLYELNHFKEIEPEPVFEFKIKEFIPQKMISLEDTLYFFNPLATKIFKLEKEQQIIESERKLNFGANFDDQVLFFSKPDQIIVLKDSEISKISLKLPYPELEINDFFIFNKNLYFLDKKAGKIVKYVWQENFEWQEPKVFIENEKLIGAKSMAIDGNVWVLKENKILKFYGGKIQEEIDLHLFPEKKDFSKILTFPSLTHLFLLEPTQRRIVVLEKSGRILKQFYSQKFDNLLDFSISKDGKTIWILNGFKVYKLIFTP